MKFVLIVVAEEKLILPQYTENRYLGKSGQSQDSEVNECLPGNCSCDPSETKKGNSTI